MQKEINGINFLLKDIVADEAFQVRVKTDKNKVKEYSELIIDGAIFPPIKVAKLNGAWYIVDGFHRYEAHILAEKNRINVEIISENASKEKILDYIFSEVNSSHGLALSNADKKKKLSIMAVHPKYINSSHKELASLLGISTKTVQRWFKSLGLNEMRNNAKKNSNKKLDFNSCLGFLKGYKLSSLEKEQLSVVLPKDLIYQQNTDLDFDSIYDKVLTLSNEDRDKLKLLMGW